MKHPLVNPTDQLEFCAFCQNPCRSGVANRVIPESRTASAMSLIARAVIRGHIEPSDDILAHLGQLDEVRLLQVHCLYGYDIAASIEHVVANLRRTAPA